MNLAEEFPELDRLDYQQEAEQERMERSIAILRRVAHGESTQDDAVFLASELGLKNEFTQEKDHARAD